MRLSSRRISAASRARRRLLRRRNVESSKVGGLVFDRDMLVAKLSPHGDDLSELFCGRIALHDPCWHDCNVFCDKPRIEAVVLGEHATGAAELACGVHL
jgi:hypothetical protein